MAGSSTPGGLANWFAGDGSNTTIVTDNLIGGGNFHPNMQPFTVVQFIIKH
jgi:microcystin-dependent protein